MKCEKCKSTDLIDISAVADAEGYRRALCRKCEAVQKYKASVKKPPPKVVTAVVAPPKVDMAVMFDEPEKDLDADADGT